MNKKSENVRKRIKQFVDKQQIKQSDFFSKTGLLRGILDTDKLEMDIGADKITNILVSYPTLSADWLLTGKGTMLRAEIHTPQEMGGEKYVEVLEKYATLQEKYTALLEECKKKDAQHPVGAAKTAGR